MTAAERILHMKIDPTLKEELRRLAAQDNRTLTNYIETVLRKVAEEQRNGRQVQ